MSKTALVRPAVVAIAAGLAVAWPHVPLSRAQASTAAPGQASKVRFEGPKADPVACIGEGEERRCCGGSVGGKGAFAGLHACRSPEFLHPAMKPVAQCLVNTLHVTNNPEVCEDGIRESYRTLAQQSGYTSLPAGYSFHNWGLAVDVCSYYKSGDCSDDNLINKVLGGVVKWVKGGKTRCQAIYRLKKQSPTSADAVAKVQANPQFPAVLGAVKDCYEASGVDWGQSNWGIAWADYFDGPHFQYHASPNAGFYQKKKAKNGPHVMMKLLGDCFDGDRKAMLGALYDSSTPTDFVRAYRDGCGAEANFLFDTYLEASYP